MDSSQGSVLASLSLTHVQFDSEDKVAYAYAYITLAPIAILVFYASIIVSRRELAGIFMLLGQLLNEGLNAILKEHLKITRPHVHLGDGYGMPSSHAQFVWFFVSYGILYMYKCMHFDQNAWKQCAASAMLIMATLVSYSRIYLGYHTEWQVMVGAIVGVTFGILWHMIVERGLRDNGYVERILDHPLAKWAYIRDMRSIDNVAKWEYLQWERTRSWSGAEHTKGK
ncbi:Dolichyldiphosphatase 1 [Apophysomyces sp. BC1034]|nr:Dolichyldiphosphatase 1 [Apophysomyces sp. BC1015]KAG0179130.1 Dolichyldiphosphatase 1 [Apophysomyces sp. BC1021]KAG0188096.1 Dolichyldiphosphatase 1 [Apophysomyces sp. BC1034]